VSGTARTLFIGLDACDPDLVRRYAAEGDMPALARLLATGARARYDNEHGYFVGSVWPTLMTGVPVDEHHWFTGTRFRPEHYDYVPHPLTATTVWERFHAAGRRVAVFDAPHVQPVGGLHGVQITEWGCHDRQYGTACWPPSLLDELEARHGTHPVGTQALFPDPRHSPCDHVHRAGEQRTGDETVALFDDLLTGIERKTAASLDLLDRGGWDLFFTVYGESHCVGHQFWHLHDPDHERHDPALLARLGVDDPVREIYRRLDAAVAAHLDRLHPDARAYVLLSHGMQAHHDGTHLLPALLHRLTRAREEQPGEPRGTRLRRHVREAFLALPAPVRASVMGPRFASRAASAGAGDLPPLADLAFIPLDNNTVSGAVRLNLAGREGRGRVAAHDRRAALDWLAQRLGEVLNVETGRPAVAAVLRGDDVYRRQPGDPLADLLIEWNRSAPITKVWSPATGVLEVPYRGVRTGDHRAAGLLLASGPGVRPGDLTIHPVDVAAVLAASAGVAAPDLPGRAHPELLGGGQSAAEGPGRRGLRALQRAGTDPLVEERLARLEARAAEGATAAEILATMAWIRQVEQPPTALVSVVAPTRNRRHRVMQAVDSVRHQTYDALEILVVDDASEDDTWEHLGTFEDPRVRCFRMQHQAGTNGARNRALDEATGEIVAYLDDDNRFDPDWIKSVVWAFDQYPERDVLYGARVVDDVERHHGRPAGGLPWVQLLPWDRQAVRQANRVDMNVLAHRRSEARFDTEAELLGDWDLLLQLTEATEPLRLPVIAAYYATDAPRRMSTSEHMAAQVERVRAKWAR